MKLEDRTLRPPRPKAFTIRSATGNMPRTFEVEADRYDYQADGRTIHFTKRSGELVAIIGTEQLISIEVE